LWLFTIYTNKTNTLIIFLNVLMLHYLHPKMHFLAVKMNSLMILESITPCYITYIHSGKSSTMKTTKKTISTSKCWIPHWKGYLGWAIPLYTRTKSHCVPCNMWNSLQYEKAYSLTLNYCTLIVWTNMVLLVLKESKSTNEFIRFCSEFWS
jgi:hypothetical protein